MKKAAYRAAFCVVPLAALLWIHWYGLKSWFWADDFAWLGLHNRVHDHTSLLAVMFEPAAQGTIRPWSESGFFLLFFHFFGVDALPYHALAFVTQGCNLLLLMWIVRKMGAPPLSASLAAILWTANAALVLPLAWSSSYNQVLCAFFLLLAFALYLSGRYWLQAVVFILGFGALEINVVYPAILLSWLLLNRKDVKPAFPLIAISVAYYALHHHFAAPLRANGPYTLHFDTSAVVTFYQYCKLVWVPAGLSSYYGGFTWIAGASTVAFWIAILWQVRGSDPPARFFLLWFLITIAPVLPLSEHISIYYLSIPALGLAAGLALLTRRLQVLPAALALLYLGFQLPITRFAAYQHFESSRRVRALVLGVLHARELHPAKPILLTEISSELYTAAVAHFPFQALNIPAVYLAPDTKIDVPPYYVAVSQVMLPPGPTLHALARGELEVYQAGGRSLKNVTASYQNSALSKIVDVTPNQLDVANPLVAYLLGSTWYPIEDNYRWMPAAATIRIAGPQTANEKLFITGYCPPMHLRLGPLRFSIFIDGKKIAETVLAPPEYAFSRYFDLPRTAVGQESLNLSLQVDRTFLEAGDRRPKGLIFGTFVVRNL